MSGQEGVGQVGLEQGRVKPVEGNREQEIAEDGKTEVENGKLKPILEEYKSRNCIEEIELA